MTFIELLFAISPDGGDGSVELACLLALGTTLTALALRRWLSPSVARRECALGEPTS